MNIAEMLPGLASGYEGRARLQRVEGRLKRRGELLLEDLWKWLACAYGSDAALAAFRADGRWLSWAQRRYSVGGS